MKKLYQLYLEAENGLLLHVCVCTVDDVKDILEHYGELFQTIVESKLSLEIPIESLTSDPILQNYETASGEILEDMETGEQFVYTYGWSNETDGYWCELLPYKESHEQKSLF